MFHTLFSASFPSRCTIFEDHAADNGEEEAGIPAKISSEIVIGDKRTKARMVCLLNSFVIVAFDSVALCSTNSRRFRKAEEAYGGADGSFLVHINLQIFA